jgi:hypothetical protein
VSTVVALVLAMTEWVIWLWINWGVNAGHDMPGIRAIWVVKVEGWAATTQRAR